MISSKISALDMKLHHKRTHAGGDLFPREGARRAEGASDPRREYFPGRNGLAGRERGKMARRIVHDHNHDGVDRRGFLECMAWAGTGLVWTASGGVFTSKAFGQQAGSGGGELH